MTRLWDKGSALDAAVLRLTTDRDPELDIHLVPSDCLGSAAHAWMLESIGILTETERIGIEQELSVIAAEAVAGEFVISREQEDGHTAIENRLTERLGDAGGKIHTGRSRNDQVIVALRLWGREKTLEQLEALLETVQRLLALADQHSGTSFPGHTHTRQAMPTTLGHHFGAWGGNLLDNVPWLQAAFRHTNRSPSGSASGFGVGLPLERQLVSDLLGFESVQVNTLAVQNDRGKTEYLALAAAAAVATDLGRLSADLLWFSSDELAFLSLSEAVTTGSSLMPQKRNPDALELIRARAAQLRSLQSEVGSIYGSLPAGYHRDLQLTKEPYLRGMQSLVDMLTTLGPVLDGLEVDVERCRTAILPSSGATDAALAAAAEGVRSERPTGPPRRRRRTSLSSGATEPTWALLATRASWTSTRWWPKPGPGSIATAPRSTRGSRASSPRSRSKRPAHPRRPPMMNRVLAITLAVSLAPIGLFADETSTGKIDAQVWSVVSRTVAEHDIAGMAAVYHPAAVLVHAGATVPITPQLASWGEGMERMKDAGITAQVSFRFDTRQDDENTAFETGIFRYSTVDPSGVENASLVRLEALLIKQDGTWLIVMERQLGAAEESEWKALAASD